MVETDFGILRTQNFVVFLDVLAIQKLWLNPRLMTFG